MIASKAAPNDTPNVTGLRQESGPSQGLPSRAATPRWSTPDADQRGADEVARVLGGALCGKPAKE